MTGSQNKVSEKVWSKEKYCKDVLGIKSDHFIYEDEKYIVDYIMTYNVSFNNKGTPFVVGSKINKITSHVRLKTFLIKEWCL